MHRSNCWPPRSCWSANGSYFVKTYSRRSGRRKNSASYNRGGDVGISRDVADEVSSRGHVGAASLNAIHGIAADNVISDRVGRRATDGVVVNSDVLARRAADKYPSETGSRSGPAIVDRDCPDVVVADDIAVLEAEIEYTSKPIVLASSTVALTTIPEEPSRLPIVLPVMLNEPAVAPTEIPMKGEVLPDPVALDVSG